LKSLKELKKVLVVDDHASMRDSFEKEFCPEHGYVVVGSIAAAALAEEECRNKRPDIVIIDVCTAGDISGLQAAEDIIGKHPGIKVIVTSGFSEISYIPRAKEIGAHSFVNKDSSLECFREAARRVLDGEYVFPEAKTIPVPRGNAPFTDREMEVLRMLCKGMKSPEIAEKLYVSDSTVRKHIENMRTKTGFDTAVELMMYVVSNGWINPNV